MKIILEEENYMVRISPDGSLALDMIKKELPDLILLDLWIPGIGGAELTKKLRQDPDTKNIPILIVSAQNNLSELIKKIGADDFISKPFDIKEFTAKVRKYTTSA
jgi:DNA-binding response OmpR family regulator